jgi:hypothetical protein
VRCWLLDCHRVAPELPPLACEPPQSLCLPSCGCVVLTAHRLRPQLSQPDSVDRDVLSHCLQLSEVLLGFLSEQQKQQQQSGLLPRLAQLCVAEGLEGAEQQGSLRDALQVRGVGTGDDRPC